MYGTLATPELVKEFREREETIRENLLRMKREAGRRYIQDHNLKMCSSCNYIQMFVFLRIDALCCCIKRCISAILCVFLYRGYFSNL